MSGVPLLASVAALAALAALGGRWPRGKALSLAASLERVALDEARDGLRALCGQDAADLDGPAVRTLCRDGGAHPSPHACKAEAAFAVAPGRRLVGELTYGGRSRLGLRSGWALTAPYRRGPGRAAVAGRWRGHGSAAG